ncbi:META domain-containing protein [Sphingomonas sp.]|uniref:META domain-containing protein n=1 Tax=Sphingomonas sp. TaxID=28214 RepID=UPI002DD672AA|nr:META domain-containing protein [Sphingomonas sp.]
MKALLLLAPLAILATPAAAQSRAEPYRALGTEPFWSLTIDRATITYKPMQGRATTVARPRPITGINGELYRARGMTVDITHTRCSDGMSDRTYADTVKVTIGRRTMSGCGGRVLSERPGNPGNPDGGMLSNSNWRISAIDGRPVRLERPATVGFTRDRIQGKICNGYGGGYRFHRGTLTTGQVISTQMYCAGGASDVENAFFRILRQPVKVSQGNRDTLVLTGGRSTVTLRRER